MSYKLQQFLDKREPCAVTPLLLPHSKDARNPVQQLETLHKNTTTKCLYFSPVSVQTKQAQLQTLLMIFRCCIFLKRNLQSCRLQDTPLRSFPKPDRVISVPRRSNAVAIMKVCHADGIFLVLCIC